MLAQTVSGLMSGSAYALVAICLVLSYQVASVINFSVTTMGTLCAFIVTSLLSTGMPLWGAVVAGVSIGGVLGMLLGSVMATLFAQATTAVKTAVTIAVALSIYEIVNLIYSDAPRAFPNLVEGSAFSIGTVVVSQQNLLALATTVTVALILGVVLSRTRLGTILKAVAVDPQTAETTGIRVRVVVVGVWVLSGVLAAVAEILIAPSRGGQNPMFLLIAPALAAACTGAMRSMSAAVIAGFAVGIVQSWLLLAEGQLGYWGGAVVPLVFVTLALGWTQRNEVYRDAR